ncbi:MAG TPA: arsenic resistance N-acetyltransferase ArsN2 [Paucimonas sp.]|nr:arsenic resistance N-acetyltransferase ArsN2 [Paucimonas sp.]HJW54523.1 arsenic resistance N-acetyltransferase ArsN2 [Burkholderiaceae bacterium]
MHIEAISNVQKVASLLAAANLPTADICANSPFSFFGIHSNGELVAAAGIERLSAHSGLLRSVAVKPEFQGQGFATRLVAFCEQWAKHNGINTLYLLTSTASSFFSKQGYRLVPRSEAPADVSNTAQFSSLCPSAASLMQKALQ